MTIINSLNYLERAKELIPVCSQTFSKGYRYFVQGVSPLFIERGEGSHIWDVDGNEYVDFILGLCPITLGYHYPAVDRAVRDHLDKGIIFSLPSALEVELSELISKVIPGAEMVRFSKTGSEACSAAVKLARDFTGREKIANYGYHGWHEWYSVGTELPRGSAKVLKDYIYDFNYNNLRSLERIFYEHPNEIAAVFMEPVVNTLPENNFLPRVKELTHRNGALLIFDEIVTGFRLAIGGGSEYFKVVPDIATFGKGMANGLPLNCVVGRRDIMKNFENIFFSGTFGGECLSLAGSIATINEFISKPVISHNWGMGKMIVDGLEAQDIPTTGYPCRPIYSLTELYPKDENLVTSVFVQEMHKRGILVHSVPAFNICYSHTSRDIGIMLVCFAETVAIIRKAVSKGKLESLLQGTRVKQAFKRL